jgi:predicted aspartyl protease
VNDRNEAVIPVSIYNIVGQITDVDTTIDTGFSGHLTLPADLIAEFGLVYDRSEKYTLGDNSEREFEIFRVRLSWYGRDRTVFALSTESDPLVGMSASFSSPWSSQSENSIVKKWAYRSSGLSS